MKKRNSYKTQKVKKSEKKKISKTLITTKKKIAITTLIIIAIITMIAIIFASKKKMVEISGKKANSEYINNQIKATENGAQAVNSIGDKAYISEAKIIQVQTGTGPWDTDDNPGNDSSENNNIVRSFDQVTWTADITMALKRGVSEIALTGGTINVEATIPTNCANIMKWDLNLMTWAEEPQVSSDGTKFTANYTMTDSKQTVPGKQSLVFVLKVGGAANETEIVPSFNFKIDGNSESEKVSATATTIKVSSKPKYDISIDNLDMNYDVERNGEIKRLYKYGLSFKLLGDNSSKGLKGVEIPLENLSFDISYTMQRKSIATNEYTDITKNLSLYNYKYNSYSNNTLGDQNNSITDISTDFYISAGLYPYSLKSDGGNDTNTIYQNGNIKMVDDNNGTIHVTITNFAIGENFPIIADWGSSISPECGYISAGIFYMSVDFNNETTMENTQSYIECEANNFQVTTIANTLCTEEVKTDNNLITSNLIMGGEGEFFKATYYMQIGNILGNPIGNGNAQACIGVNNLEIGNLVTTDIKNSKDNWIYDIDILTKIDDKNLEPVLIDGEEYIAEAANGTTDITFNILYAGKKDKTGWASDNEMINTSMDELVYFDTLKELKQAGYTCVATLAESQSGTISSGISLYVRIPVQIKSDASIGSISQALTDVRVYTEKNQLDRTTQTHLKTTNANDYPPPTWADEESPYIKTQYDQNGQIATGTHYVGPAYGNSLTILGAEQNISIRSLDENNNEKTNFDIGKNENMVKYEIKPTITNRFMTIDSKDITIKIEVKLPVGLQYRIGSCEYAEPETIENGDGTTTLVWYKNQCKVNQNIEPIQFEAKIDNESKNGQTYEISAIMSEVIEEDGTSKLGNSDIDNRKAKNYISIIDLSSHRAYKDVEESVIVRNDIIKYKIIYENKTEQQISNFQLLDILPYNNDGRESNFSGTYTIESINVKQTISNVEQNIDNLSLYITNSDNVRSINAKDSGIGIDSIWTEKNIGENINEEAKGIALKGEIKGNTSIEIELTLKTNNNNSNDLYVNNAMIQVYKDSEQIETGKVEVKVIDRILSGKVWGDSNNNGIIDNNEKGIGDIKLTLINTSNNVEQVTTTDSNGDYVFNALAKDNYKIRIEYSNNYYLTEKEVGEDETINSKINVETNETDEITTLNNISFNDIEQKYVNAGLILKKIPTSLLVHYYKEGTTEKLSNDVIIKGNVGDEYTTYEATDIPSNYELVEVPSNSKGTLTDKETVVTYYYRVKDSAGVIVHHIDTDTKEPIAPDVAIPANGTGKYGDSYITEVSNEVPANYEYVTRTDNWQGTMVDTLIEVTYEYKLKSSKITNTIIKKGTEKISKKDDPITYNITYNANIQEYVGNAQVTIIDTLDYAIDISKSTLNEGIYDPETHTITWQETIEGIDTYTNPESGKIEINKKITVVYTNLDTTKDTIENKASGKVKLFTPEETSTEVTNTATTKTEFKVNILVRKEWVDQDDVYNKRPNTINIQIKNGEDVVEQKTISKEERWEYTFKGLPKYDENGQEIQYTVDETEVKEGDLYYYTKEIGGVINRDETNSENINEKEAIITNRLSKVPSTVVVKYKDINTGEEINDRVNKEGIVGTPFDVTEDKKDISGYTLVKEPYEKRGTYTEEPQEKIYYYAKNTKVIVKYLEKGTSKILSEEPQYEIDGYEGLEYTTEQKEINDYVFVENTNNTEGTMTKDEITVIYYYLKRTQATVQHIDRETGEILKQETEKGKLGDLFETHPEDFDGYVLVETPEEPNITMDETGKQIVKYYYAKVSAGLIEKHIDEITGELLYSEEHQGNEGDQYDIPPREFDEYDLVTEDSEGNSKLPENAKGTMTQDLIEVKYYYIKKATVRVEYIDKLTNEKLTEDEIIQGHENDQYKTEEKEFYGYNLISVPENAEGTITITKNEDGTYHTEIVVTYYYIKQSAGVIEKHIDINTNKVLEEETHTGNVGDEYDIPSREFEGYDLVKENEDGNNMLPTNAKGTMSEDEIEVIYYYKKIATVKVEYIDKQAGKKLDEGTIKGHIGDNYETEEKQFDGYELEEVPNNSKGKMEEEEILVQYYYKRKTEVEVQYVEKDTNNQLAESDRIQGYVENQYETKAKDIPYYKLVGQTENTEGKMTQDKITVIYYYEKQKFNLSVDKWVSKVSVDGSEETAQNYNTKDQIYKLDIHRKKVNTANIKITYLIRITNTGEIEGTVGTLTELIPEGYSFNQQDNEIHWEETNGILTTDVLKDQTIEPGKYKEIEIVLRWNTGETNFGEKDNTVIISNLNNPAGYEDINKEDNTSKSQMLITIATGLDSLNIIVVIGIIEAVLVITASLILSYKKKRD